MKSFLIANILTVLLCAACGIGANNGNPSISASQTSGCSNIKNNTCTITLNYNTGGQSGLTIGIQYNGPSYPQEFIMNIESCSVINQNQNQVCAFPVTFGQGAGGHTQNMTFTLGSAQSNQVSVSD